MNFLRQRLRLPSLRSLAFVGFPAVLILLIFWIACAAEMRSNYMVPNYTLNMAITNAYDLGLTDFFRNGTSWFLPGAAVLASVYLCFKPGRGRVAVALLCALLPVMFLVVAWDTWRIALLPLGPLALVSALTGQDGGEWWGEGWVMLAALGTWADLWLVVGITELARAIRAHKRDDEGRATSTSVQCSQ